jgi:hypothetical protein
MYAVLVLLVGGFVMVDGNVGEALDGVKEAKEAKGNGSAITANANANAKITVNGYTTSKSKPEPFANTLSSSSSTP